jgi:hypothetical protein
VIDTWGLDNDFYLGIPFTRDIKLYGEIILKEFQNRKWKKEISWKEIHDKLQQEYNKERSIIFGYMNYKLRPLITCENVNKEVISQFIYDNYVKPKKSCWGYFLSWFSWFNWFKNCGIADRKC